MPRAPLPLARLLFRPRLLASRPHGHRAAAGRSSSVPPRKRPDVSRFRSVRLAVHAGWQPFPGGPRPHLRPAAGCLRHTGGSGSVRVAFDKPVLRNGVLPCPITREAPEVGTDDMAYYCFALAVWKSDVIAVELHVHEREANGASSGAPTRAGWRITAIPRALRSELTSRVAVGWWTTTPCRSGGSTPTRPGR